MLQSKRDIIMKHIFHVHTYRCKHGSDESDEEFIKAALSLGAEKITFTEHCPFPENPFKNRMEMEQLPEYIESLKTLQAKYQGQIQIETGLEVEYLPSMINYYKYLYELNLHPLIIGQHFFQHPDGTYSFDDKDKSDEYIGCSNAMIEGMKTGYFSIVAHPDRFFRRCKKWTQELTDISNRLITTASQYNIILEKNLSSYEKHIEKSNHIFWRKEFWDLVELYNQTASNPIKTIIGFDAHSTEHMLKRIEYIELLNQEK